MATNEYKGRLTYIDGEGNQNVLYPMTQMDAVDGLGEAIEQEGNETLAAAKAYTDQQIAAIPGTDVAGPIATHNTNTTAHADIRTLANNAQSTANTAKSTADTAKTNAATAQSTADTAKTNAATAQSTADEAKSAAATAQTTANNAATAASNAQSTADAAQSAANAAQQAVNALSLSVTDDGAGNVTVTL